MQLGGQFLLLAALCSGRSDWSHDQLIHELWAFATGSRSFGSSKPFSSKNLLSKVLGPAIPVGDKKKVSQEMQLKQKPKWARDSNMCFDSNQRKVAWDSIWRWPRHKFMSGNCIAKCVRHARTHHHHQALLSNTISLTVLYYREDRLPVSSCSLQWTPRLVCVICGSFWRISPSLLSRGLCFSSLRCSRSASFISCLFRGVATSSLVRSSAVTLHEQIPQHATIFGLNMIELVAWWLSSPFGVAKIG